MTRTPSLAKRRPDSPGQARSKLRPFKKPTSIALVKIEKVLVKYSTEAKPPYIFGNYSKAEVEFICS
jgi:hypothetical protein